MDFVARGVHEGADTKFVLAMNFPVIEDTTDRLSMRTDTLNLATDVVNSITDTMGVKKLPPEVVRDIFSTITFLSADEIETWMNFEESKAKKGRKNAVITLELMTEAQTTLINERFDNEVVMEEVLASRKRNHYIEGVMNKKHFYSSWGTNPVYDRVYDVMGSEIKKSLLQEEVEEISEN